MRIFGAAGTALVMQDYDAALKRVLTKPGSSVLRSLTGCGELRWLNVELPKVRVPRVDLLGERADGELVHIEFQSSNESGFALRMAEYAYGIARLYSRLPRQIAIYVGQGALTMANWVEGPGGRFEFELIDVRDLDGTALLASSNLSDNVIAVLTRKGAEPGVLAEVAKKVAKGPAEERASALSELAIWAKLRGLRGELEQEIRKMPITEVFDIEEVLEPWINIARERGIARGREEGREEGRAEGRELLISLVRKRFGAIPPGILERLETMGPGELQAAGLRIFDAECIDDLFV